MNQNNKHKKTDKLSSLALIGMAAIALGAVVVLTGILFMFSGGGDGDTPDNPTTTSAITSTAATSASSSTVITTVVTTEVTTTETTEPTTEATTAETTESTTEATTVPTTAPTATYDDGDWNLVLVNPWNAYPEELVRGEENNLVQVGYASEYVDYRIIDSLNAMLDAGSEYGLAVTSSYRSYDDQVYFYNNKVDRVMGEGYSYEEALDIAATEVARPGTSEHHTGLAVDLVHNECWALEEYWEDYEAFDWLMEHCADYGFILRFPKEKQDITGVIYEPWHYRYVGVDAAREIMSRGITLEEYLGEY